MPTVAADEAATPATPTTFPAGFRSLSPPFDIDGPRVRLGILWILLLSAMTMLGRYALALALTVVAAPAAAQTVQSWRARARKPIRPGAVLGSMLMPLGAAADWWLIPLAVVVMLVAGVAGRRGAPADASPRLARTLAIAVLIGGALAAPVLLHRERGPVPVLALFLFAAGYDAGNYLIGSGARSLWEGPIAGVAVVGSLTLAVAALFVPPFRGMSPLALGALAGALAPLGPLVATLLLGDRRAAVPALRRIDSLLVLSPIWCAVAWLVADPPTF